LDEILTYQPHLPLQQIMFQKLGDPFRKKLDNLSADALTIGDLPVGESSQPYAAPLIPGGPSLALALALALHTSERLRWILANAPSGIWAWVFR
jgi:hypothetical protein